MVRIIKYLLIFNSVLDIDKTKSATMMLILSKYIVFFFLLFLSNSLTKDKTNKTRKESKSSEKAEILVDQVS
jgi:hypothetical protein